MGEHPTVNGGYRPHLAERTGIPEEEKRRRTVFARFIDRRVTEFLASDVIEPLVNRIVDQRLKAEVAAIVEKRMEDQRRETAKLELHKPRPSLRDILNIAAEITEREYDEFASPRRSRAVAWPRFFAYWLVKKTRPDLSLPAIGRAFGGRNHTTIMSGLRKIDAKKNEAPFVHWVTHPKTLDLLSLNA